MSENVVGECSATGELPDPFQLKKDVSLFGASDILGLGAGTDSFDVEVRCVTGFGSPLICSGARPLPALGSGMVGLCCS